MQPMCGPSLITKNPVWCAAAVVYACRERVVFQCGSIRRRDDDTWRLVNFVFYDLMHKSNKFQLRVPAPALLVKAVIKIHDASARSQRAGCIRGSVQAGKAQRALGGALATATRVQRNEMQWARRCEAAVPNVESF